MFEFLEGIFKKGANFFIDNQHAITKRLGVGLIVLGLAFTIDDQIGFSFYYASNQKIQLADKLTTIISSDSTDLEAKVELKKLRLQVLKRKGIISHLWDLTKSAINSRSTQTASANPNNIISPNRNIVLHVLSSNWMLLIITAVGFVGVMIQKRIGGYEIAGIILIFILIGIVGLIFSFVFSYIPTILSNPNYNYALNAILHFLIMILIIRIIAKNSN